MSASLRLWRRAPLWRGALLAACASTALGLIYADQWFPKRGGSGPAPGGTSRYVPAAVSASPVASPSASQASQASPVLSSPAAAAPPYGQTYRGTVSFADRLLPLPRGEWLVVGSNDGHLSDGRAAASAMLARIEQGRAGAIVLLFGSATPDPAHAGFMPDYTCQVPDVLYGRVLADVDHGPQECWSIDALYTPNWRAPTAPAVLRAGMGDLDQRGAVPPQALLRVFYRYADQDRWLSATYMFGAESAGVAMGAPADWTAVGLSRSPDRKAFFLKVRQWMARWQPLVKQGFAGNLTTGDVAPVLDGSP